MAVIALAAAERQRRFRERKKKCAASYWVDADDRVLTMLTGTADPARTPTPYVAGPLFLIEP